MKLGRKVTNNLLSGLLSMGLVLLLASCGGGGGGSSSSGGGSTTTVSGKVTLSSQVTAKPTMMAAMLNKARLKAQNGNKPAANQGSPLLKALSATNLSAPAALSSATIELYDANKPEWLSPVAIALSDGTGSYTLDKLTNSTSNLDAAGAPVYKDGDSVPAGNYTVIASKFDSGAGTLYVAVQAVVKKFAGSVSGNDLVAQNSDVLATVSSMIGLAPNADGTFGSSNTSIPLNANIQVTFSMAMARQSVVDGLKLIASDGTTVSGKWKVSPDLTAATFYPTSDLTPNTVYTIKAAGGKSSKPVRNIYGKALAATVNGSFKSAVKDITPPTAVKTSPTTAQKTSMPISTPLRIGVDEEMDITSITVTSTPSIGDKPTVKYVGLSTAFPSSPYIYEITPSSALQLGTTYTINVSGGVDMAGNLMDPLAFSFTTEATSAGVTVGASTDVVNAQLAVKDVLGKWVNAMNARNSSLLSSYMSGDFFWINDTSHGMNSDDLNRDGRLSLSEFTGMMNNLFKELDRCNSTVTGDVAANDPNVIGGIAVNGSTATLAFNLTITPGNTNDATCNNNGPKSTLYAVMENINQAWTMTHGSEMYLATYPANLAAIDLVSPANGNQFADPSTSVPLTPLTPDFKWTAVADATGTPASTYLVVLIDNNSRQLQTGWAALVDGSSTAAGSPMSVTFNGMSGDYGNVFIPSMGGGGNNPLGFNKMITEIKSGGSYSWAVIGFSTKTLSEFKALNFDPATYLFASSVNNNFTVAGVWKQLTTSVVGAHSNATYTYSDTMGGYNVGSDGSVTLTITTPNSSATSGYVSVSGYTSTSYYPTFSLVNGVNTAVVTIPLSQGNNWVYVDDGFGLSTDFSINTTGGTPPLIAMGTVTAKTCAGTAGTLVGPDSWSNYTSGDACTVTVPLTVDATLTGTVYVYVNNNNGNGTYSTTLTLVAGQTSYTLTGIPVYNGSNWISFNNCTTTCSNNQFSVDTTAGSTYVPPIAASVTDSTGLAITKTSGDIWQSYWDAGAAGSVTVSVTMPFNTGGGYYYVYSDPNWTYQSQGSIVGTTASSTVSLFKGWNYIQLSDGAGNWYTVNIYTTGGTAYTLPNSIDSITDGTTPLTITTPSYSYYQYPASGTISACSVTINGTTTNAGNVTAYLSYYNNLSGASVYETQTATPTGTGPYTYSITSNVYNGSGNTISVYDSMWNWQGVQVTTSCSTAPIVFGVTSVSDGTNTLAADMYGTYNATTQTVTVTGTATTGKNITAYVSGMYYGTQTVTAASNTYSIGLPIYTGYNSISLTDGTNWSYLSVNTTNGSAYTPPINTVTVKDTSTQAPITLSSGGAVSDTWSSWNTSAGTVDISGNAQINGAGVYYLSNSSTYTSGTFTISGGTFTLPGLVLAYGYNYIYLYDANWNSYSVTVYTSGGAGAPVKVVAITSPTQNASVSGSTSVSGTIDTTSFTPAYIYAYVYDYTTGTYTYGYWDNGVTSDATIISWGEVPITYSAGSFSVPVTVAAGDTTNIEVYAYDATWTTSHGHYIYVNNALGYADGSWKPGAKPSAADVKARAHQTEFIKKMMRH